MKRPALRFAGASVVFRPFAVAVVLGLVAVLLVLICIDVARGDFDLSLSKVVDVFGGGGKRAERFIVLDVRLPRVIIGVLVGAALGMAGALTQSTVRNPLASPDLLGITAGASFCAVLVIVFGETTAAGGALLPLGVTGAALLGGLVTALVIYLLAWRRGFEGFRLILIGIGVNAMLIAAIGWMLIYAKIEDAARTQIWLNGSLNSTDWSQVWPLLAGFVVAAGFALVSVPSIAALRLGDDKARSLGVGLQRRQGLVLLAAVLLASFATAVVGPVGFVALAAPQIAKRIQRCPGEPLIASAVIGAILLIAADIVARTLLPVALPVGIITSALGGIFLLYLLVRANRRVTV